MDLGEFSLLSGRTGPAGGKAFLKFDEAGLGGVNLRGFGQFFGKRGTRQRLELSEDARVVHKLQPEADDSFARTVRVLKQQDAGAEAHV